MGSIRTLKANGKLFFDFRYQGYRCREYTDLSDTAPNRKKAQKLLGHIEKEIMAGTFEYAKVFPTSKMLAKVGAEASQNPMPQVVPATAASPVVSAQNAVQGTPTFEEFADLWYSENEVAWRRTHRKTMQDILKKHLKPGFGGKEVGHITKQEILAFRSVLAKVPGRKSSTLSPKRINAIMGVLRQILNEAADRFHFSAVYHNIKSLKVPKSDVQPFNLEEVNQIITNVRPDYRNYYTVRFFTGLRTGEIDGLKWQYVDFENRLILVRETIVAGEEDYTKTDGSQRDIQMSQIVYDALKAQKVASKSSKFVFCNSRGEPLENNNVTKRVWYPLLRHLGLRERRPYQTRHTAATLWLASGENPQWIARQLGHASTEMVFHVYARFVPNLTRRDGSAFERLLARKLDLGGESERV